MKTLLFLVAYAAAIVLAHSPARAQDNAAKAAPAKQSASKASSKEVLPDAQKVELREIQLEIERAQSALKDAKLAVVDRTKDVETAMQKANADILRILKEAKCEGCQLAEEPAGDGKKQLTLTRPAVQEAKK